MLSCGNSLMHIHRAEHHVVASVCVSGRRHVEGTSQHTCRKLVADTEETDRQAGNTQDARRRKMRKSIVTGRHPGVDRRRCGGAGVKIGGSRFSSGHRMKLKKWSSSKSCKLSVSALEATPLPFCPCRTTAKTLIAVTNIPISLNTKTSQTLKSDKEHFFALRTSMRRTKVPKKNTVSSQTQKKLKLSVRCG